MAFMLRFKLRFPECEQGAVLLTGEPCLISKKNIQIYSLSD